MAVRTTMLPIIGRVRQLIGDPAGMTQAFSNQEIQDNLDLSRVVVRYQQLEADPTLGPSSIQYLEYHAENGCWEGDAQLLDASYNPLNVAEADTLTGRWTLHVDTYPPVWINGKTYDVYRAALDLLSIWGARDPSVAAAKTALVSLYSKHAKMRTIKIGRDDVNTSNVVNGQLPLPPGWRSRSR